MDFKIILFIFVWIISSFAAGAPQLTCPSQTVSAEEGGSTKISVFMDPPTDITFDRVNIKRADQKDVYIHIYEQNGYRNKNLQAAEYKNRTSLTVDLARGVLDLEIRNLSLKDSGLYRVSSSKYRTDCTFNISVAAKVGGGDEGAPQLTCPSQTVSAEEGESVNISVFMDPPTDITYDRVNIKRADQEDVYVHIYEHNGYRNKNLQAAEYKNRTSVTVVLTRGVLDLEIRNLSLKDSGSYRVSSSKYGTECTFNISVAAKVDGADEGHSQTETLKTFLLATVVLLIIIVAAAAVVIYLWRSGWIRKVWPRVRGRVCLFGRSQGPDPDPEAVQSGDGESQVPLSST